MAERRKIKNSKSAKHHAKRALKKSLKKPAGVKKTAKTVKIKAASSAPAIAAVKDWALPLQDSKGKTLETVTLDPIFQGAKVNTDIIYQSTLMYQAGEREGTACTKERGAVRGGGKKPWKQKGTGQARHGSRRSPIWRGGGVTFGPMPRDYSYAIPGKIRRQAVVEGLKDKISNQKLFMVQTLEVAVPKTSKVVEMMETLKLKKPLFLVEKRDNNFVLASRNIPGVAIKTSAEVNALDILSHKECVMTREAYHGLLKRLKS